MERCNTKERGLIDALAVMDHPHSASSPGLVDTRHPSQLTPYGAEDLTTPNNLDRHIPLVEEMDMKKEFPGLLDCDQNSPTVNQRRQKPPSLIERLPTEILQQIFLAGLNGNLLKASPRIAAKLSSSQIFYRTSFFIAFYPNKLLELRDAFRLESLLPDVELPLPFWELRSMVKAVLNSRWCKWWWVKNLLFGILKYVAATFTQDYASATEEEPGESTEIEKFLESASSSTTFGLHRTDSFCRGSGKLGGENELHTNLFNMAIISRPNLSQFSKFDEEGDPWEITEHLRLRLYQFGDIPLETAKLDEYYPDNTPFRNLIHRSFGLCGTSDFQNALSMWQHMEKVLYTAIMAGEARQLQQFLQMDYYFRPDDVPYHIPTPLFYAAAEVDCHNLDDNYPGTQLLLHVLFKIDPYSLPRDGEIIEWVILAQGRVRGYAEGRYEAHLDFLCREYDGGPTYQTKIVRECREDEYIQKVDIEILRFLNGVEPDSKPNMMSPNLALPVLWSPDEAVDFENVFADDDKLSAPIRKMTIEDWQALVGGIIPEH